MIIYYSEIVFNSRDVSVRFWYVFSSHHFSFHYFSIMIFLSEILFLKDSATFIEFRNNDSTTFYLNFMCLRFRPFDSIKQIQHQNILIVYIQWSSFISSLQFTILKHISPTDLRSSSVSHLQFLSLLDISLSRSTSDMAKSLDLKMQWFIIKKPNDEVQRTTIWMMYKDDKEIINDVFDLDHNKFLDFMRKETDFNNNIHIVYEVFDDDQRQTINISGDFFAFLLYWVLNEIQDWKIYIINKDIFGSQQIRRS